LPIALGILAATGQIPSDKLSEYEYAGELALTGELRPIRGALAMIYRVSNSGQAFILPQANAAEVALVEDVTVYAAKSLLQVAAHLTERELMQPFTANPKSPRHIIPICAR
jgi:magnesium chelatase family protein